MDKENNLLYQNLSAQLSEAELIIINKLKTLLRNIKHSENIYVDQINIPISIQTGYYFNDKGRFNCGKEVLIEFNFNNADTFNITQAIYEEANKVFNKTFKRIEGMRIILNKMIKYSKNVIFKEIAYVYKLTIEMQKNDTIDITKIELFGTKNIQIIVVLELEPKTLSGILKLIQEVAIKLEGFATFNFLLPSKNSNYLKKIILVENKDNISNNMSFYIPYGVNFKHSKLLDTAKHIKCKFYVVNNLTGIIEFCQDNVPDNNFITKIKDIYNKNNLFNEDLENNKKFDK